MKGLLISDSLLKNLPNSAHAKLRLDYQLDLLDVVPYPGYTTERLIGESGVVHDHLETGEVDHIFLCSGANDFNRCAAVTSERRGRSVIADIQGYLHSFCTRYPHVKVTFFPIPYRSVCHPSRRNPKFPNNYDDTWINDTNRAIHFFQENFEICHCHQSNVTFVSSPNRAHWLSFLEWDGLHLTENGKKKMIDLVCDVKESSGFFHHDSFFPGLPQTQGPGFTFEPQVKIQIPKRIPRRPKPHFISIQSLYFGPNGSPNECFSPPEEKLVTKPVATPIPPHFHSSSQKEKETKVGLALHL